MCATQKYSSTTCAHDWFEITKPCGKGKNFEKCESFKDNRVQTPRAHTINLPSKCPECDGMGKYDGEVVRMVGEVRYGEEGKADQWVDFGRGKRRIDSKRDGKKPVKVVLCEVM